MITHSNNVKKIPPPPSIKAMTEFLKKYNTEQNRHEAGNRKLIFRLAHCGICHTKTKQIATINSAGIFFTIPSF